MYENSVYFYDVDCDGWIDIVVVGWGEDGIYWYKNFGDSVVIVKKLWEMNLLWKVYLLMKMCGMMEMFVMYDYDGDGVFELYFVNY